MPHASWHFLKLCNAYMKRKKKKNLPWWTPAKNWTNSFNIKKWNVFLCNREIESRRTTLNGRGYTTSVGGQQRALSNKRSNTVNELFRKDLLSSEWHIQTITRSGVWLLSEETPNASVSINGLKHWRANNCCTNNMVFFLVGWNGCPRTHQPKRPHGSSSVCNQRQIQLMSFKFMIVNISIEKYDCLQWHYCASEGKVWCVLPVSDLAGRWMPCRVSSSWPGFLPFRCS